MNEKARNYYQEAEKHAIRASELASDAREYKVEWKKCTDKLSYWNGLMNHNPIVPFTIIFIIVAICEYAISVDLYTDLLPMMPFIIPMALIAFGVVISHWLGHQFIEGLKLMEYNDKIANPAYSSKTDEQIMASIKRQSITNFIVGLLFAIAFTVFIYYMSAERVEREIAAGMRTEGFGFYDSLPVALYIAELITGVYIIYLFRKLNLRLKIGNFKRRYDKSLKQVAENNSLCIESFEKAEKQGFDILTETINDSIHVAFFRNKNLNISDEDLYIAEPQSVKYNAKLSIARSSGKLLKAQIHVHTEFNYTFSSKSNEQGEMEIFLTSFEGDSIKKVIATFEDGDEYSDDVNYKLENNRTYSLMFTEKELSHV